MIDYRFLFEQIPTCLSCVMTPIIAIHSNKYLPPLFESHREVEEATTGGVL